MIIPNWAYTSKMTVKRTSVNGRGETVVKTIKEVPCRIEPSIREVSRSDGTTFIRRAKYITPVTTEIMAGDTIECSGESYTVEAVNNAPSLIGYSHKEGSLS